MDATLGDVVSTIWEPATLTKAGSDVGTEQLITITAQDKDLNSASCSFIVIFEGINMSSR